VRLPKLSFQAKLKLITFEFSESQKLLEKALFTAEKYGQDRMRKLIMKEQTELSRNLIKSYFIHTLAMIHALVFGKDSVLVWEKIPK